MDRAPNCGSGSGVRDGGGWTGWQANCIILINNKVEQVKRAKAKIKVEHSLIHLSTLTARCNLCVTAALVVEFGTRGNNRVPAAEHTNLH